MNELTKDHNANTHPQKKTKKIQPTKKICSTYQLFFECQSYILHRSHVCQFISKRPKMQKMTSFLRKLCDLFIFHFSFFLFHFSFFIFHFSFFVFHFSLFTFHFSRFTFHCSLFTFPLPLTTYRSRIISFCFQLA